MENEKLAELEKSIRQIDEKISQSRKTWVEYLAPLSTFFSTVILGAVGLWITNRVQHQQFDTQTKIQKVQVLKDFLPYIGDSNADKNKAALIAIASLGFDSLAVELALGINNEASKEVLESKSKTSTGDRKILYENALQKLRISVVPTKTSAIPGKPGLTSSAAEYPNGLANAMRELADSAREIPLGSNSGRFVKKYANGTEPVPWTAFFVSWCFLNNVEASRRPFKYTGSVSNMLADVKENGFWFSNTDQQKKPEPGDIYFIINKANSGHCGIVFSVKDEYVAGIEANVPVEGEQVNRGDRVALRTRTIRQINGGFARIPEK